MWILNRQQQFHPIPDDESYIIGRGREGVPDDVVISRQHTRIKLIPSAPSSSSSSSSSLSSSSTSSSSRSYAIELSQLGRHPIFIFRFGELSAIGWIDQFSSAPSTRAHLEAKLRNKLNTLERGHTCTLAPGDAFGISTTNGIIPFWFVREKRTKNDPSESSSIMPITSPSLSLTPPISPTIAASVCSSSLRPVSLSNVPDLSLNTVPVPTTYIEPIVDSVASAGDESSISSSYEAARVAFAQEVHEQSLWCRDQYPPAKRRKIIGLEEYEHLRKEAGNSGTAKQGEIQPIEQLNANVPFNSRSSSFESHSTSLSMTTRLSSRTCAQTNQSTDSMSNDTAASSSSSLSASAMTTTSLPSPSPSSMASVSSSITASTSSSSSSSSTSSSSSSSSSLSPPTIAFPPLAVLDCQFSPEKANPLAFEAIRKFLSKHSPREYPHIRMTLVVPGEIDAMPVSAPAKEVYDYFTQHSFNDHRFQMRVGDITHLTSMGIRASYLVHPTTWRFVGGEGGRITKYMHESFVSSLLQRFPMGAKIGGAYVTGVANESQLAQRCRGLVALFSIATPNMNPTRANCLEGDYAKGCKQLVETYGVLLHAFEQKVKAYQNQQKAGTETSHQHKDDAARNNTRPTNDNAAAPNSIQSSEALAIPTTVTMTPMTTISPPTGVISSSSPSSTMAATADSAHSASKPASIASASSSSPSTSFSCCSFIPPLKAPPYSPPSAPAPTNGPFTNFLYAYIQHPRPPPLQPYVFWEDEDFAVIYDAFPKSRIHLLLVPKRHRIDSIINLNSSHIPVIDEMDKRAGWLCDNIAVNDSNGRRIPLRRGFHTVPSLHLLHLHIVSQDFDSVRLKNKKHWNSFTTPFFIQPNQLISIILKCETNVAASAKAAKAAFLSSSSLASRHRQAGVSLKDQLALGEKFLTQDLRCHRVGCGVRLLNMPDLKKHLQLCTSKPYPTQTDANM